MITIQEGKHRLLHNKKTWMAQKSANLFDPTKYYWADATPNDVSWASIQGKLEDLIAALAVNVLPILLEKNGADAYGIKDDEFYLAELKTSYVSFHTIWQSSNGTLYTGIKNEKNKKSTLKSSHEAKYSVTENNIHLKKMTTFFVLLEDKKGTCFPVVIEGRKVNPEQIYNILLEKLNSQKSRKTDWNPNKAISIGIKYATIESNSVRADFDGKGYSNWEIELKEVVKTLNKDDEAEYYIARSDKKTAEFLKTPDGINSMGFLDWSTQQNSVLLNADLIRLAKIGPSVQISTPCTEDDDQSEIQV